jgi:hypothetical protein
MSITIHDVEQRSEQWFALRLGLLTGTGSCLIWSGWDKKEGRKKGSESVQRRDLRLSITCELMTGEPQEENRQPTADMLRGIEKEQDAFDAYEMATGRAIRKVGFVSRSDLRIGCSPDGLIGDIEGGVELKCPKSATHLGYIRDASVNEFGIPDDYVPQIRHNLYVTGAAWWDFVSFDDRLPAPLNLYIRRLHAAEAGLPQYDQETRAFLAEVERERAGLQKLIAEAA